MAGTSRRNFSRAKRREQLSRKPKPSDSLARRPSRISGSRRYPHCWRLGKGSCTH